MVRRLAALLHGEVCMVDEVNEAPTTEAEASPVVDTPTEQKPPERDKLQERVGELTYRLKQIEAENAQLRSKSEPSKPELVKPTLEQSGYDEDKHRSAMDAYTEALIDRKAEEKVARALEEREAKAKASARDESFQTRLGKLTKEERDLAFTAQVTDVTAEIIKESDVGVEVLLHLANNPDIANAIAALPEKLQARELGKLEARLEKPSEAKDTPKPVVSKAPPPAPRLEATEAASAIDITSAESDKLSDAEWVKRRNKQVSRRG